MIRRAYRKATKLREDGVDAPLVGDVKTPVSRVLRDPQQATSVTSCPARPRSQKTTRRRWEFAGDRRSRHSPDAGPDRGRRRRQLKVKTKCLSTILRRL